MRVRILRAIGLFAVASMSAVALLSATGCASVPPFRTDGSAGRARTLLLEAASVQGSDRLLAMHDVNVHYEGQWGADVVAQVQPVLVDKAHRGSSQERYLLDGKTVAQTHTGPAGTKYVLRTPGGVRVWYDGVEIFDRDVLDAAALVTDGYRLFLFGPAFFIERHAPLQYLGTSCVDDRKCDDILAVLTPGIGNSPQDRVVVSIDQQHHVVRRVRITVEGMQSTKGAVADVYLREHTLINGVLLPTRFKEELKSPFDVTVHDWRLVGIDFDRNLQPGDINGPCFFGPAISPAGSVRLPADSLQGVQKKAAK